MFQDIFTLNGRWNRLNRLRYFLYSLLVVVLILVFAIAFGVALGLAGVAEEDLAEGGSLFLVTQILFGGFGMWTSICLGVKRLHDLDKTGWLWLILLIPLLGIIFWFYLLFAPGTRGENRFGSDPLETEA